MPYILGSSITKLEDPPKSPSTKDYVLEDIIGQGSFGEIYKARRLADGAILAMKAFSKRQVLGPCL